MKVYCLQITTRKYRDDDKWIHMGSSSLEGLKNKFRKYAEKNKEDDDYLGDDWQECIDSYIETIETEICPELNIAYFTYYFTLDIEN
jgi:hypothetical protein